ncbi:MAG: Ku protein, partial [Thermoanaerobaculia bacterium]
RYKDEYRERLMDRIRDKSKGKAIVSEEPEEEEKGGEVIDIMDALRRSLEGGRSPAKRASSAKSTITRARKTATSRKKTLS